MVKFISSLGETPPLQNLRTKLINLRQACVIVWKSVQKKYCY